MSDQSREQKVQAILHGYLQAIDRGEKPDREQILARHPDLRDDLATFFSNGSLLDQMAQSLRTASFGGERAEPSRPRIRYFGDYELLDEIAHGGMGVVYKARQVSLSRVVALKMILKGELASEAEVRRFRQEAEAAANLDHPNIVPIYEVGEHEGHHYFSMKLIGPGKTQKTTDQKESARRLTIVARAVHHAHQRGILHRDLKPSNILFDENGEPHVADFGLAKPVTAEGERDGHTRTGAIVGTPSYMAPEQARAEKLLTTAVDVYSVGAVLYEWLTGRPPFRGEDPVTTLFQVVHDDPTRPRSLNGAISLDLETICLKCLEKEPSRRYGSAEAVADDLDRWLRGEPIQARRIGMVERARKWAKRRPAIAGLTTGLVVLGISIVVGSLLFARELQTALQHARSEQKKAIDAGELAKKKAADEKQARLDAQKDRKLAIEAQERAELTRYSTLLNFAQRELHEGNIRRARQLLLDCPWNLRGWEHRFLWTQMEQRVKTFRGHTKGGWSVNISPDGKRIASSGWGGTIRVWDSTTGDQLLSFKTGKPMPWRVLFSPDGTQLLTLAFDGVDIPNLDQPSEVKLWDAQTGKELRAFEGHKSAVHRIAFDPKGIRIATVGDDKTVKVWDVKTAKELFELKGHENTVQTLAFSPEGKALASSDKNAIRLWNLESGKEIYSIPGDDLWPDSLAFDKEGKHLLTWRQTPNEVLIYDAASGKAVRKVKLGPSDSRNLARVQVQEVAFTADGRRCATSALDGVIRIWDLETGQNLLNLEDHFFGITDMMFSSDGTQLLSTSTDGLVKLWDVLIGPKIPFFRHESERFLPPAFSSDGRLIAAIRIDGSIEIRDAATTKVLHTVKAHGLDVQCVAFEPKGKGFVSAGFDGVKFWDLNAKEPTRTLAIRNAYRIALHPDGNWLAIGTEGEGVELWDIPTRKKLKSLPHENAVGALAFSRDGKWLACGSHRVLEFNKPAEVKVWPLHEDKEPLVLQGHADTGIYDLAFSPDDRRLATAGVDGEVRLWDVPSGKELRILRGHTGEVTGVSFSADGKRLVSISQRQENHLFSWIDGETRIWDVEHGVELLALPRTHEGLYGVAFSPDGQWLATTAVTSSPSGLIQLRHASPEPLPRMIADFNYPVTGLAFTGDGKQILSVGGDQLFNGEVKLWNAESGGLVQSFKEWRNAFMGLALHGPTNQFAAAGVSTRVGDVSGKEQFSSAPGNDFKDMAVAYSPSGEYLVAGNASKIVRLIHVPTGKVTRTFDAHEDGMNAVAFHPDGKRIATAGDEETVKIWDVHEGKLLLSLPGHKGDVGTLAFSPDGNLLFTGDGEGNLRFWDLTLGKTVFTGDAGSVHALAISPDGKLLASGGIGGTVTLWEVKTGKQVATLPSARLYHGRAFDRTGSRGVKLLRGLAFSPDGNRLAVGIGIYNPNGDFPRAALQGEILVWERNEIPAWRKFENR